MDFAHVEASGYDRRHTTGELRASLLARDWERPKPDLLARAVFQVLRAWYNAQPPPPAVKAAAKKRTAKKGCRQQQLAGERSQDDSLH